MTYVSKILTQMTDVFKPQQKATLALLNALMCFSGRATMRNLARYDAGSVKRLRRWASVGFQFFDLNQRILTPSRDFVLIGSTAGTGYTDTDVINGTEYCYYTTAVNDAGESEASGTVCATPEDSDPAADVILDYEIGRAHV